MNKIFTLALALCSLSMANAAGNDDIITLDLTKATTEMTFDATTGAWNNAGDEEITTIDSQCFSFIRHYLYGGSLWFGFTASNSADNSNRSDFFTYQYSNMAEGGIVLNEDGTIKVDDFGKPVTSSSVPYLVSYYSIYNENEGRVSDVLFNDGKLYDAVGIYVNLNSYAYYSLINGDAFARAFTNGDKFSLIIHGVAPNETEKTVDVTLGSYTNGDLTINRGWKYVDLTSLGTVKEIYFTLETTDSGAYGPNTPYYFCIDKLMVKKNESSSAASLIAGSNKISYDRANKIVTVGDAGFAAVYDVAGHMVMSSEAQSFSIDHLSSGVYVVKSGNNSLKIVK